MRRKRVEKWSRKRWMNQVHTCFVKSPAEGGDRATIVVHMDLDLLPKNTEEAARLECAEAGVDWEGFRSYAVFCLECSPSDYAGYRMGDTVHEMMKDLYREVTVDAATQTSREWIGTDPIETDFDHTPGLFQAAFLTDISGKEADLGGAESFWRLPPGGGPESIVGYPINTA